MSVPAVTDSDISNVFERNPSLNFSAPSFAIFSLLMGKQGLCLE